MLFRSGPELCSSFCLDSGGIEVNNLIKPPQCNLMFLPVCLRPGVMFKWSEIFDHGHGQKYRGQNSKFGKFDH